MPYPHHLHPHDGSLYCRATVPAGSPAGRHVAEIILLKDELYHDIDYETLQVEKARSRAAGGSPASTPAIATDDTSRYMMNRYIDRYINDAMQRLSPYLLLPSPYVHRVANNHTREWQEKSILVAFPATWPPTNIEPLRDAVHELIVKGTQFRILSATLGANDLYVIQCDLDADDADRRICAIAAARNQPLSCGYSPFG